MLNRGYLAGIAGAFFAVATSASPASAQCGPGCDGMANWSGIYVGVGVGGAFDMIGQDYVHYDTGSVDSTGSDDKRGGSGLIGTVSAGYDWHVRDRWVVGAFTDFDFGASEHKETDNWYGATPGMAEWTITHNNTWTVGGRVGLLTTNTAMVYGLLGYSRADVDVKLHAEQSGSGSVDASKNFDFDGLTVGAGLEQELGNGFFLKGEYRYTTYGDESFGTHKELDPTKSETDTFDLDTHSIRASLVYKFGRDQGVEEVSYKDVPPAPPYK
jgi:outer membrane immunogenic protein